MLNDSDLRWRQVTSMSEHERPSLAQRESADLSKGALSYATKEIEVEKVDLSVEINGLMSLKGISGQEA